MDKLLPPIDKEGHRCSMCHEFTGQEAAGHWAKDHPEEWRAMRDWLEESEVRVRSFRLVVIEQEARG